MGESHQKVIVSHQKVIVKPPKSNSLGVFPSHYARAGGKIAKNCKKLLL